jgi:hypothetical protein
MPFIYRYRTPPLPTIGKDAYGFAAVLDVNFARQALETPITKRLYDNIQEKAIDIIVSSGMARKKDLGQQCHFVDVRSLTSCLLQYCTVPGNGTDLLVEMQQIEEMLDSNFSGGGLQYNSDNVNNPTARDALKTIWEMWIDEVERYVTKLK